jgi:L-seryl-tRNA(Ser) seleniumtransferase
MLTAPVAAVRARADAVAAQLRARGIDASVVDSTAGVGGGAFPGARIASAALALAGDAVATEARLRGGRLAIIGRIAAGSVLLDLRSVPPAQDAALSDAVVSALS